MARRRIDQQALALRFETNRALQIEAARLIDETVVAEAAHLARKVLELAMAGSEKSLLFCLDRAFPKRRPFAFKLPSIKNARDISAAIAAITTAVNHGKLTCEDAAQLARLVESYASALKTYDLGVRLEAAEAEIRRR